MINRRINGLKLERVDTAALSRIALIDAMVRDHDLDHACAVRCVRARCAVLCVRDMLLSYATPAPIDRQASPQKKLPPLLFSPLQQFRLYTRRYRFEANPRGAGGGPSSAESQAQGCEELRRPLAAMRGMWCGEVVFGGAAVSGCGPIPVPAVQIREDVEDDGAPVAGETID